MKRASNHITYTNPPQQNRLKCLLLGYKTFMTVCCDQLTTQPHLIQLLKSMGKFFGYVMQLLFCLPIPLSAIRQRLLKILLQPATSDNKDTI